MVGPARFTPTFYFFLTKLFFFGGGVTFMSFYTVTTIYIIVANLLRYNRLPG